MRRFAGEEHGHSLRAISGQSTVKFEDGGPFLEVNAVGRV